MPTPPENKPPPFSVLTKMTLLALMMGGGMYYMWFILGVRGMDVYGSMGIAGLISIIGLLCFRR